jgi:murein DD-endopeptidase MepM/ murein hydrolase activator NlpD
MPFDTDFSHGKNSKNEWWHDAYDIGTGKGAALYGNPVYVPFDGQLCHVKCSNEGYGCYYVLTFDNGGEQQKLLFAHFQDPNPQLSSPGSCMQAEAGFMIGLSGTRGFSDGNHLHYGAAHGDRFSLVSNPGVSILETLVPEDNDGNYPPVEGRGVTTCYE